MSRVVFPGDVQGVIMPPICTACIAENEVILVGFFSDY